MRSGEPNGLKNEEPRKKENTEYVKTKAKEEGKEFFLEVKNRKKSMIYMTDSQKKKWKC